MDIPTWPQRIIEESDHVDIKGQRIEGLVLTARTIFQGRELSVLCVINALTTESLQAARDKAEHDMDAALRNEVIAA